MIKSPKIWKRRRASNSKDPAQSGPSPSSADGDKALVDGDGSSSVTETAPDCSMETRTLSAPFLLVTPTLGSVGGSWGESAVASQQTSFAQRQRDLLTQPPQVFLSTFRENGSEFISAAYLMTHPIRSSLTSSSLATALPEDVFALVEAQVTVLGEYINYNERENSGSYDMGKVLVDGVSIILHTLQQKHSQFRDLLLDSLQACIAYANDFLRMLKKVDDLLVRITTTYSHLDWNDNNSSAPTQRLKEAASNLVALYGRDAVYASQRAANFIIQSRQGYVSEQLFSREWEDVWVHQEVAREMVRSFDSHLSSIHTWLENEYLYHKVVVALVRNTVSFYCLCLIRKAERIRRSKRKIRMPGKAGNRSRTKHCFNSSSRAILRMSYDLETFQEYFNSISSENVALGRAISEELFVMGLVIECMGSALEEGSAVDDFVVVVHKRTGANSDVTRHFLRDIWLLTTSSPTSNEHSNEQQKIDFAVRTMKAELEIISAKVNEKKTERGQQSNGYETAGRLDEVLRQAYEDKIMQEKSSVCGGILPNNMMDDAKNVKESRRRQSASTPTGVGHLRQREATDQIQDLGQFFDKLRDTLKFEHFRHVMGNNN